MKCQYEKTNCKLKSRIKIAFFIICALLSCTAHDRYTHTSLPQAGICLSFDDRAVDAWFRMRELLAKYEAKVTFFVTQWDSLTPAEINKLKILQQDGHEIAFHGARHVLSEYYIKEHSLEDYLNTEILAGIKSMQAAGFYPTTFAYPYSAKYWGTDRELLKYFYVLRSEEPLRDKTDASTIDACYYENTGERLVYAITIDRNANLKAKGWEKALNRAWQNKEVLLLYGHTPMETFDVAFLEEILAMAKSKNLKFFRTSDLIG